MEGARMIRQAQWAHYFPGRGWNLYDADGTPVGCLDESSVEFQDLDPDGFDPNTYPYEDSPGFHPGELYGADRCSAH